MTMHTSREFEKELRQLRDRLLAMAGRAEAQIRRAVEALLRGDDALADQVIADDEAVDHDELAADELAFLILARRQPVASDLRFVMFALKVDIDLERIGDLAVNVAKRAKELRGFSAPAPILADLEKLAARVMQALAGALDAFVRADATAAEAIIEHDPDIDALNTAVIGAVLASATTGANATVRQWLSLSSISRYLERIGDHATNIAEMVIYYVRGRDVRHHGQNHGK